MFFGYRHCNPLGELSHAEAMLVYEPTPADILKVITEVTQSMRGEASRILNSAQSKLILSTQSQGISEDGTMLIMGLGFFLKLKANGQLDSFEHDGSNKGFKSHIEAIVDQNLSIVAMTKAKY